MFSNETGHSLALAPAFQFHCPPRFIRCLFRASDERERDESELERSKLLNLPSVESGSRAYKIPWWDSRLANAVNLPEKLEPLH